ncbi:Bifunctional SulP family inorganic anion transporter/carbonic anhydrase OS=Streptomyces tendae OX=1932 GN=GUR47_19280 PE=3 SV=1 [Streptomyces tendae]
MLHGVLVVIATLLMVPALELIPLASLAALVMAIGIEVVWLNRIRTVTRHREVLVYAVTTCGVVFLGVLEGVALGIAVAVGVALHRLTRTRITHDDTEGVHHVHVRGQLTFLAVPRLSRVLHQVPHGADAVVELDGSFMDHAAYETLQDWQKTHAAHGGSSKAPAARPGTRIQNRPRWTAAAAAPGRPGATTSANAHRRHRRPARNDRPPRTDPPAGPPTPPTPPPAPACAARLAYAAHPAHPVRPTDLPGHELARGVGAFHRNTGPLMRRELARLAREGRQPCQLFLTCADSRVVTSMITSSGPGDLFVVRNVGNFVPPPGEESGDDSVAAAIEYAVDVLKVRSITVCGHSGCGAMQALLGTDPGGVRTPLQRWLRHGLPSLERVPAGADEDGRARPRLAAGAPADAAERLCLANVVQQLEHLRAHDSVAQALGAGDLELHGMYFHVGEAQSYLLSEDADGGVFELVREPNPTA